MRKIYIVLTYTGTFISKAVKIRTGKQYSHVSISLDKDLNQMYSFGRIYAITPLIAGFVQESPKYGTFKRFSNTDAKIYSLDVDDKTYNQIKASIEKFNSTKGNYKFNFIGLVAAALNVKVSRDNYFYCAEFIKYLFDNSDIGIELPDVVKPDDFNKIKGSRIVYTGKLSEYNI